MPRRFVTCPNGHRNDRTGGRRKCATPDCGAPLPKVRRPKHTEVLRGDSYPLFVKAAREIHGVSDEACCVCGKPRSQERHHDRDHDHATGQPRGLACAGNQGCNALMPRWLTAARAQAIADYLRRVDDFYAEPVRGRPLSAGEGAPYRDLVVCESHADEMVESGLYFRV